MRYGGLSTRFAVSTLAPLCLCLLLLVVSGSVKPCEGQTIDTRPIIVVREDDCGISWKTPYAAFDGVSALDYAKAHGIPITWAVIVTETDAARALSWTDLRNYLDAAGGELASHSYSHQPMPDSAQYISELVSSKAAIESALPGYQCTTFLEPGSWTGVAYLDTFDKYDNAISQAVMANYAQSQAYLGQGWRIGPTYYRYGMTSGYSIDYAAGLTEDSVRTHLAAIAATPGMVRTISCHMIQAPNATKAYAVQANIMRVFIDELVSLRDAGKIRLMSLRDAYNTPVPSTLNRMPNPSFEFSPSTDPDTVFPWRLMSNSHLAATDGVAGTRCAALDGSSSRLQSAQLILEPGQYELSWYQKPQPGYPSGAYLDLTASGFEGYSWMHSRSLINHQLYKNTDGNAWERKVALIKIKDRLPNAIIDFWASRNSGGTYGRFFVDDVALLNKPADPSVTPTNITLTPTPTGCTIAWDTPTSPTTTDVAWRYSGQGNAVIPSSGVGSKTKAYPGTRQQASVALNWNSYTVAYFSLFGMSESTYSDPGIDYIVVDKTGPTVSNLVVTRSQSSVLDATWNAVDPDSSVYGCQYAVGTYMGGANIVPWTDTTATSAHVTGISTSGSLYFTVKARNVFGYWSGWSFAVVPATPGSIAEAIAVPDGSYVSIRASVSAVFGDCYYIEQADRARTIKVLSNQMPHEGDVVTASGDMTTLDGERVVDAR